MTSSFKLHIIPPPIPLNWSSPRALLIRTLWTHLIQDQAPIGHFFIEIETSALNRYGVKHVLTGMSRANSNQSTLKVISEKIGLGSFFLDFEGKLDHSKKALKELIWAKKKNRLKTIQVKISPETGALLMEELQAWIHHGSFKHYGGGHLVSLGQGAGCAEFGAHFFSLALGRPAIPKPWIRSVYAPKKFTGGALTQTKVSLSEIILKGDAWAESPVDGFLYSTPDMELATEWLNQTYPGVDQIDATPLAWPGPQGDAKRIQFQANYPKIKEEEISSLWNQIKIG